MALRSRTLKKGSASPPFCPSSIQASWTWDSETSPTFRASCETALASSRVDIERLFSHAHVSLPEEALSERNCPLSFPACRVRSILRDAHARTSTRQGKFPFALAGPAHKRYSHAPCPCQVKLILWSSNCFSVDSSHAQPGKA